MTEHDTRLVGVLSTQLSDLADVMMTGQNEELTPHRVVQFRHSHD